MRAIEIEDIEFDLLLDALYRVYGYDFRNYSRASLKRRISSFLNKTNLQYYAQLIPEIMRNKGMFQELLLEISVTVTEMFRDANFYRAFRDKVVPILKTYPFIKIWHAGCATGEEVYSIAILLHEAGFLEKAMIYATDINHESLKIAQNGIYSAQKISDYTKRYNEYGGKSSFSDYYHADYGAGKMKSFLKKNVTWANHNLVTDASFGEMNVVICRNVLIYFDKILQDKVFKLFSNSLIHNGFLCIGTKEAIDFSAIEGEFSVIAKLEKIYRKK